MRPDVTDEWVTHPLEGRSAVRSLRTDVLYRHWRKGQRGLIWRGSELEAQALCNLLNGGLVPEPKGEMDKSQRIMYATKARKRTVTKTVSTPFRKCTTCGRMVKTDNHC